MADPWRFVGDRAILRAFDGDLTAANASAFATYNRIAALRFPEVEDVIPGARSLLVILERGGAPSSALLAALEELPATRPRGATTLHEIPVRYGGEDGPDLGDVARMNDLNESDVVRMHSGASYVVGFTGFSPGFPYLFGMPAELASPRMATPRTKIAKGSVGIGGPYTGIYPQATAGGWRIIGRTNVELFDPTRDRPALLRPGDTVRFLPA